MHPWISCLLFATEPLLFVIFGAILNVVKIGSRVPFPFPFYSWCCPLVATPSMTKVIYFCNLANISFLITSEFIHFCNLTNISLLVTSFVSVVYMHVTTQCKSCSQRTCMPSHSWFYCSHTE